MKHFPPCGAVAAVLAASSAAMTPALAEVAPVDEARAEYEVGHYDKAFAVFARLADEGHCDAARIAGQMVRYGRVLYATAFEVPAERLARWQQRSACQSVSVAGR
jgi:hypothetical protein